MRILHVFRSPAGGLFRHVRDLARGQSNLGHKVGIFCDSSTGGKNAEVLLALTAPFCSLGIHRSAMSKLPGIGDVACAMQTRKLARDLNVDVIHGHGAKGGLYGRLGAKFSGKIGIYTPHGGSLHYDWGKLPGPLFLGTEWLLRKTNGGMVFVCEYEKNLFARKIGLGTCKNTVVHNGLWPDEFVADPAPPTAAELLFVGEMRTLKGVDVLLRAIKLLREKSQVTATLVGDGPDIDEFKALSVELGLESQVKFVGLKKMADAISLGKVFVLPSRNESFPYVMLEAIAAHKAIIATNVGGIGEVIPADQLCPPEDAPALAAHIAKALENPKLTKQNAENLATDLLARFNAKGMAEKVSAFYQSCR